MKVKRETYMRHFMMDFMEFGMRKVIQDNSITCAKKVGYFQNRGLKEVDMEILDVNMENCLGKHSDSYEYALE